MGRPSVPRIRVPPEHFLQNQDGQFRYVTVEPMTFLTSFRQPPVVTITNMSSHERVSEPCIVALGARVYADRFAQSSDSRLNFHAFMLHEPYL